MNPHTLLIRGLAAAAVAILLHATAALAAGRGAIYSLAAYPDATCNDHKPAAYYFRPAPPNSAHATRWLFYLEGGGLCNSDTKNGVGLVSCADRYKQNPGDLTADGWAPDLQGILSEERSQNPDMADANVVDVHYCSSDYWSGGKTHHAPFTADDASTGWDFHGRAIATAALADLARRTAQTNFENATELLFAGSSAGGEGIAITLNDLLPLTPPSVRTRGVLDDAGFALEIAGFIPVPPFTTEIDNLQVLIGYGISEWGGHGDTKCWRRTRSRGLAAQIGCYDTGAFFTRRYFDIPVFVAEADEDAAQLELDGWKRGARGSEFYLLLFMRLMLAETEHTPEEYGAFVPGGAALHTLFATDATFNRRFRFHEGRESTPREALAAWLAGHRVRFFAEP